MPARKKNDLFRPTSKKEWANIAKLELGKDASLEKLVHPVDGIDLPPYYDQHDLPSGSGVQLAPSQNEFQQPRAWLNIPRIIVHDALLANRTALTWLNAGADGILFDLQASVAPEALLKNIELNYCYTSFLADTGQQTFFDRFDALLAENKNTPNSVGGAIYWKTPPSAPHLLLNKFFAWQNFHPLGVLGSDRHFGSDEIASLLTMAVKQVDALTTNGFSPEDSLRAIAFLSHAGTDFFSEVAKLKVLRMLWRTVVQAYSEIPSLPFIHAVSNSWKDAVYDPHGNMLKSTMCGLSAVLGGCDALTIDPAESKMARVALNVSSILKEEAHLGRVADPTAGSYYVETLIDVLAKAAWKKFQSAVS